MLNQNHANAFRMDEAFEPYLKRVLETHSFGVSRRHIELNCITSTGDRFDLSIPYAGQILHWTVMFNSSCPDLGPDFEFNNDSFLPDPDVDTIKHHIPSLANWRPRDPECLLDVLTELTSLYKLYQIDLLGKQAQRFNVEYRMMTEREIRPEDVEVVLSPNESSPTEAKFFIRLDMDFSRLPGRSNRALEDRAMLVVSFQHPNWSRVVPQLYLSLPLETTFGGPGNLHIPPFPRDRCVTDYLPEVKRVIDAKIEEVAKNFETRKQFVATLMLMQRRHVVEYDAIDFTRATILLEHRDFYFLVHFQIPSGFPKDQPIVNLQSIYHTGPKDELLTMQIQNYPYSPRWTAPMMISKMLNKIIEQEVVKFKKMSGGVQSSR